MREGAGGRRFRPGREDGGAAAARQPYQRLGDPGALLPSTGPPGHGPKRPAWAAAAPRNP